MSDGSYIDQLWVWFIVFFVVAAVATLVICYVLIRDSDCMCKWNWKSMFRLDTDRMLW